MQQYFNDSKPLKFCNKLNALNILNVELKRGGENMIRIIRRKIRQLKKGHVHDVQFVKNISITETCRCMPGISLALKTFSTHLLGL